MYYPGWCLAFFVASLLSQALDIPYPFAFVIILGSWYLRDRVDPRLWLNRWSTGSALTQALREAEAAPFDAEARYRAGAQLLERGRPAEAVPHLRAALERIKSSAEIHFLLGSALLGAEGARAAEPELSRALELEPRFRQGLGQLRLAQALLQDGRASAAYEVLLGYFGESCTNVEALVWMGEAARGAGREDDARRAFAQAKEAFRTNPRFRRRLDRVWVQRARRGLGEKLIADRLTVGIILAAGALYYLWQHFR